MDDNKILICTPNSAWANQILNFFTSKNYSIDIATTGKDAQVMAYKNRYFGFILDLDIKDHAGILVLKYLRLNFPSRPVVLTIFRQKLLEDVEMEKKDFLDIGCHDVMIAPFNHESLYNCFERIGRFIPPVSNTAQNPTSPKECYESDDRFTSTKIEDFINGSNVLFDYYLRLGKNKYLKVLHKGDHFEKQRIEKYIHDEKITHLFFKSSDRKLYIKFISSILSKMTQAGSNTPTEVKLKTTRLLCEKYIEESFTQGLKPDLINQGMSICQSICDTVSKDKKLASYLEEYGEYDPPEFAHLFLTTMYSTIIVKGLAWGSTRVIQNIAFASLFHDLGKLKIPVQLWMMEEKLMNAEQLKLYKSHPLLGYQMLEDTRLTMESTRQIVFQHHEFNDKSGFPNALSATQIYPLAKIVSLADFFSYELINKKLKPIQVIQALLNDRTLLARYDPEIIKALITSFIKK